MPDTCYMIQPWMQNLYNEDGTPWTHGRPYYWKLLDWCEQFTLVGVPTTREWFSEPLDMGSSL